MVEVETVSHLPPELAKSHETNNPQRKPPQWSATRYDACPIASIQLMNSFRRRSRTFGTQATKGLQGRLCSDRPLYCPYLSSPALPVSLMQSQMDGSLSQASMSSSLPSRPGNPEPCRTNPHISFSGLPQLKSIRKKLERSKSKLGQLLSLDRSTSSVSIPSGLGHSLWQIINPLKLSARDEESRVSGPQTRSTSSNNGGKEGPFQLCVQAPSTTSGASTSLVTWGGALQATMGDNNKLLDSPFLKMINGIGSKTSSQLVPPLPLEEYEDDVFHTSLANLSHPSLKKELEKNFTLHGPDLFEVMKNDLFPPLPSVRTVRFEGDGNDAKAKRHASLPPTARVPLDSPRTTRPASMTLANSANRQHSLSESVQSDAQRRLPPKKYYKPTQSEWYTFRVGADFLLPTTPPIMTSSPVRKRDNAKLSEPSFLSNAMPQSQSPGISAFAGNSLAPPPYRNSKGHISRTAKGNTPHPKEHTRQDSKERRFRLLELAIEASFNEKDSFIRPLNISPSPATSRGRPFEGTFARLKEWTFPRAR